MAISKHADVAIEMEENVQKQRQSPVERHKCPRCHSENTKFCYYNNYSLSQPRYFCKACRRYWTKGGALRNIPFGGSGGKSKRGRKSSDALMSTTTGYCTDHHQFTPPPASLLTSALNEQLQLEIFFSNSGAGGAAGGNNIGSIFHQGLYGNHDHCSVPNHGLIGASGGGIQQQQIVQLQQTTLPFPVQSEPLWINEFIMPWPAPTIIGSSSSPSTSYSSIPLFNQHGYRSFW